MEKENFYLPNVLSQSAWWVINKAITAKFGFDVSVLLSDLISKQNYFRDNNQLDSDGYFFNYKKNIKEDTTITEKRQDKAVEILKKNNLISVIKKKGIPPKLFYKVNIKIVNKLIADLHE